jgi:hypothetical protein
VPSETVDELISLWKRLRFTKLILETTAYQESLKYALEDRFKKEGGRLFRIVPEKPGRGQSKEARIEGMQPAFKNGWWYVRADQIDLMDQLDSYPLYSWRDILDALAYVHMHLPPFNGMNDPAQKGPPVDYTVVTYEDIMRRITRRPEGMKTPYDIQLRHKVFEPRVLIPVTTSKGIWPA